MSLARMAIQFCTAPGKVLVTPCWRYIAEGRHREFQWRMFTVGQSLWSAFERVGGGVVWRVTRVTHCDQMGQDYGRYGSFTVAVWNCRLFGWSQSSQTHTHKTDRISPKSDTSQNVDIPVPSFEDFVLLEYGIASLDVSTKFSSSEVSGFLPRCSWGVRSSGTMRRRRAVGWLPIFPENMSQLDPKYEATAFLRNVGNGLSNDATS